MKHLLTCLAAVTLLMQACIAFAEAPDKVQTLPIQVGQKWDYTTTADLVFAADDTIATVQKTSLGHVTITGVRAGTTQIIFSDNGVLQHINVVVSTLPSAQVQLLTPQFKTRYPFILYEFNNSSTFTKDNFYQTPSYSNNVTIESPFGVGHLRANLVYQMPYEQPDALTNGTLSIQYRSVDFLFGALDSNIGRLINPVLSAVPGYGPRLRIYNPFIHKGEISENLNVFTGVNTQTNLEHPDMSQKKSGINYEFSTTRFNSLFKDFFNVAFVGFQPPGSTNYNYNAVLEEAYHVNRYLQLGLGGYWGTGGWGSMFQPILETPNSLTRGSYRFVKAGLEQVGGTVYTNTEHNTSLSTQILLKDRITYLTGSFGHAISLDQGIIPTTTTSSIGSTTTTTTGTTSTTSQPSSTTTTGQMGVTRQYSISRRYGGQYAVSNVDQSGITTLVNSVSGVYTHPVTRISYLQHTLSLSQTNSTANPLSRQVQLTDLYQIENAKMRHMIQLNTNFTDSTTRQLGFNLSGNFSFFLKGANLQFLATYTRNDVETNINQIQFGPIFLLQPTTTQLIQLSTNMTSTLGGPSDGAINGTLNLLYRTYLGPGVVRDSLLKKIFAGGGRQSIGGRIFLDVNYNGRFEDGDIMLEGTTIVLDGKSKTITGPQGQYNFSGVKPGSHTIVVEPSPIQGVNTAFSYSFMVSDTGSKVFNVPVTTAKGIITVRTFIDTNDNRTLDDTDIGAAIAKVTLIGPDGKERTQDALNGGAIFNGADYGDYTITISPADAVDGLEAISPLSQKTHVSEYKEYIVNYLFKPSRSLRGRIKIDDGKPLPGRISVTLGNITVQTDKDGYYWFKTLPEGMFDLSIGNVPGGYCVLGGNKVPVQIVSPFAGNRDFILSTKCE